MELYEGPFLDGQFEPAEILVTRASLHSKFLRHVKLLARALRERTRHAEAAQLLTRALEADALAEELYQGLMLALQHQGRNAEALSVYRRCRDIFQAHLGIGPSPETEAIHQALLSRARPGSSGGGAEQEPDKPARQASRGAADPTDGGNSGPNGAPPAETKAESLAPVPTSPANGDARPFIAVLPFANLSEDRAMNALGAGLAEDLITLLSPCRRVRVAACHPAFRSADASADVRQVGRELGVSHVVRGSLRFSREEQLSRITVQLADASTGEQVWAAHYDQPLREAFAIEDNTATGICRKMVTALFRSVRDRSADGPS
jgi:TolB-like protein